MKSSMDQWHISSQQHIIFAENIIGRVTDVHKGVVYVRLSNSVYAVAHSCYDYRMPGKKDNVSFAVTRLDIEQGVAVGIITRIIRQNL